MLEPAIWFVIGLVALAGGAELLVRAVSKIASFFGIPRLIIGLTVVAFGTSAPELAVSIQAGTDGQTDLMLGNIVGSNISNTLLILGISALIIPLKVNKQLIKSDVPILVGITILVIIFALNGMITFVECVVLSILLVVYLLYLVRSSGKLSVEENNPDELTLFEIILQFVLVIAGFAGLIFGAGWLIDSSLVFAEMAGVSELVIGLTFVAIGTSLPEIVVAVVAALKGERDIAVGSVIGSNILNLLAVLGVSGLFIPGGIPVQDALLRFDLIVLIAITLLCLPLFYTGHIVSRWEGALLFGFYLSYVAYLYLSATGSDLLSVFGYIMLYLVIPITLITVIVITAMEWKKRFRFRGFQQSKGEEENE